MSFFGIGKKKLDEQSREEQSAETAKVQKEQTGEDAPKSARLSEKIMEQQQWEDSLRRFVKSESARQQNNDEEQNEEHRAVEDLKRALLNGDEKVEESSAADELTEEQVEEQERRSLLAALGAFPQGSEEPVEVEQVAEGQDVEEDAAPVAEAPKPATPAFLRDDEEAESEDASVEEQEPKDAAEDARSHFEEHLRALRAQNTEDAASEDTAVEDAEADADTTGEAEGREELEVVEAVVEASENKSENAHSASESEEASADAEDSLTVEDMKAARTHAAVTEAQNAGLDDLAAAYAARLGITLDSEEETFGEVASGEVIAEAATDEAVAEEADSAEATEDAEATEPTEVSDTEAPEIFEAAEAEETVDLTAVVAEAAEPAAAVEEEPIEAVVEAPELLASELTEEESAVSEETELLSAVSVEEKHEVSVSESLEAEDFDAEEENTAELIFDASAAEEPATEENAVEESAEVEAEEETPAPGATATEVEDSEVENLVAEGAASEEDEPAKSASVAPALAAAAAPVAAAAAVASAAKAEKAEEKTEKGTSQGIALTAEGIDKKEAEKHESAAREESAEAPVAELKETEQKLSEDEAELVAESIILSEPVEGAATLPVLPEQRALHGLAELMRTRGSGTMSLELRQVDEDMHYRLLHRGREIETGIVVPGVDWFAPVAALYTEAQQAGATWNRAAVSLKPRLGDGLEVHASYLGATDGQTTGESFLLGGSTVEAKPVATAEAAEATLQDEPQEAAVQSVDSVEAEREAIEHELEAELAEKQAANEAAATAEAAEEPVVESAEEGTSSGLLTAAGLAAAGTAVAGAAASAQEKEGVEEAVEASDEPAQAEFAPVEAEFEHDYENDPVFGATTVEPETEQAEELTAEAAEASETSAQASDESGEDMEAALAAIVANAQKKLDTEDADVEEAPAEDVPAVEDQKAAAPVVAESFTLDRTQPVEEAAEEPAAEQTEEPTLPAFLEDSELLPEHEASAASAEAHAEEPALEDVEPAAESASVAPGLAGALAAAAAVGTAGAAAKATEAKATGAQEEPAEKAAELKTVEVTPAAKIAEAPAVEAAPASEATAQATPVAPTAEAAPAAATTPVALPESTPAGISSSISASALSELNQLPTIVAEPDTPSAAVQSPLVPSETQLATGNLVLTEAQVAQRLAPVVEHLFGENGTAKDATTVLIRVRALGSYYDALTHVRRNGFWEQVRTFELIPETLLDIPALKTDSYSEGEGSPLAMSLTFTPGVPVQAAFDYANEQAFVTYPRPLDAERYVEELRMFPRLGSKIPAHMTSALSHWNL